ncbi:MAG TPA: hypothetical protein ENN22_13920 [bacterium]|nr:hypothetical protein [bacterium]
MVGKIIPEGFIVELFPNNLKSWAVSETLHILVFVSRFFFIAFILWIGMRLIIEKNCWRKILSLVVRTGVILLLIQVLTLVIYYLKSKAAVVDSKDIIIYLGPELFVKSTSLPLFSKHLLSGFNVPALWWLLILVFGLINLFKVSLSTAVPIVLGAWISWQIFIFVVMDALRRLG